LPDFDVVVVGGGCAGLWAAHTAGAAGADTLLVERQGRIGGRIACAEGVGAAGIGQFTELAPECVATTIDGARLYDPEDRCIEVPEPGCGYVLNKGLFLRNLALAAARSGAECWVATKAVAVRALDGGRFVLDLEGPDGRLAVTAGAVVGADGIESAIGRQLEIQKAITPFEVFSCAQYVLAPVDLDPHQVEFHFGAGIAPGGYAWVFPKGQDIANVGVGVICSRNVEASPLEYLRRFKAKRCPGSKVLACVFGGVPTSRAPYGTCGRGAFLAGDAGRVADPVSGSGIVPAMETAELAARAAVKWAEGGSGLRSVEREFRSGVKALFRDRALRFAVRKILAKLSDAEAARMLNLVGEYASERSVLKGDPFSIVKFMIKAMPGTFGLVRHLVRS
jgi:digeranylgeranylglycerophospholipid reductase